MGAFSMITSHEVPTGHEMLLLNRVYPKMSWGKQRNPGTVVIVGWFAGRNLNGAEAGLSCRGAS
jgi:hypothetical protein